MSTHEVELQDVDELEGSRTTPNIMRDLRPTRASLSSQRHDHSTHDAEQDAAIRFESHPAGHALRDPLHFESDRIGRPRHERTLQSNFEIHHQPGATAIGWVVAPHECSSAAGKHRVRAPDLGKCHPNAPAELRPTGGGVIAGRRQTRLAAMAGHESTNVPIGAHARRAHVDASAEGTSDTTTDHGGCAERDIDALSLRRRGRHQREHQYAGNQRLPVRASQGDVNSSHVGGFARKYGLTV